MRVLAHRGASAYAPENTYAAFDLACKMTADAIETDFRCTRDGVLVLMHDERVDRTTDGTGLVSDLTSQQIRHLDAGCKFSPEFAGQRVPLLSEFLDRYAGRIGLCLEAKGMGVVDPLVALLKQKGFGHTRGMELTSFEWETIVGFRNALPQMHTGYLARRDELNADTIARLVDHGVGTLCPPARQTTVDLVKSAHGRGLKVRVWGIYAREDYDHALRCGADGATVNWPDWGKAVVV